MAASTVLSTIHSIPGKKAGSKNTGKSADSKRPTQPPTKCPECASQRIWKDGLRYVKSETATIPLQRFICRDCGRRFSENNCAPPNPAMGSNPTRRVDVDLFGTYLQPITRDYKAGNQLSLSTAGRDHRSGGREAASFPRSCLRKGVTGAQVARKVGPRRGQVWTLSQTTRMEKAERGATKLSTAEIRGKIVEFSWFMKQEGYRAGSVKSYVDRIKKLVRKGANLTDVQSVRRTIAGVETWSDGTKKLVCDSYDVFVRMENLTWIKPRYKYSRKLPFIPTTEEIDLLIHNMGFKVKVYVLGLKETGAGPLEMYTIEWKDIDFKRKKLSINNPTKGHKPRILDVSDKWLHMVSRMPRKAERVWTANYGSHYDNFRRKRIRLAEEYGNPRLKQISFRTFRHWKGTMEYHRTRDPFYVRDLLGHHSIRSTEIYIHLEEALFRELSSEYEVRRTRSIKGCLALAAVGFEKFDQVGDVHLYRKPKAAME